MSLDHLTLYMAFSVVFILSLAVMLLRFTPAAAGLSHLPASRPYGLAIVLLGWLAFAVGLGWTNLYVAGASDLPTIQFGIFVPIVLGVIAYYVDPGVRALVRRVPQAWLVGIQIYRLIGAIFVVLWSAQQLPAVFAWPAGFGDIAIGLAAPLVAYLALRQPDRSRGAVLAWNLLGLLDLVVALATGFLTSPSRFQMFAFDTPNLLVAQFPLVLIPTFLVPLSILLHLASLAKLKRG